VVVPEVVPPVEPPVVPVVPPPDADPVPPPVPLVPLGGGDPGAGDVVEFGGGEFVFDEPPPQLTSSSIDGRDRLIRAIRNFNPYAPNTRVRRGDIRHSITPDRGNNAEQAYFSKYDAAVAETCCPVRKQYFALILSGPGPMPAESFIDSFVW